MLHERTPHHHDGADPECQRLGRQHVSPLRLRPPAEAVQEVRHDHGGDRVDPRVDARHGRGEHGGHHETRHTGRQVIRDEPREDLVGVPRDGDARGQRAGILQEVAKQRAADRTKREDDNSHDGEVHAVRPACSRRIARRHVPLDGRLVPPPGADEPEQRGEERADHRDPRGRIQAEHGLCVPVRLPARGEPPEAAELGGDYDDD